MSLNTGELTLVLDIPGLGDGGLHLLLQLPDLLLLQPVFPLRVGSPT